MGGCCSGRRDYSYNRNVAEARYLFRVELENLEAYGMSQARTGRDLPLSFRTGRRRVPAEEGCSEGKAGFRRVGGAFSCGRGVRSWHHIRGEILRI